MFFYVKATASGPWRSVDVLDQHGHKQRERVLIMALEEEGKWCVDNRSVDVVPGLCITFSDVNDALWFVNQRRAQWVAVEPGIVLAFEFEGDAQFFVMKNLGKRISEEEARRHFAEIQAQFEQQQQQELETGEEGTDDMLKTNIENKAAKPAPSTKKAAPKGKSTGRKGK